MTMTSFIDILRPDRSDWTESWSGFFDLSRNLAASHFQLVGLRSGSLCRQIGHYGIEHRETRARDAQAAIRRRLDHTLGAERGDPRLVEWVPGEGRAAPRPESLA